MSTLKFFFILVLFLFSLGLKAQQLNGEFGVGLGWTFNSDDGPLPNDAVRSPLRLRFQTGLHYEFNKKWGLGLELSTSVFQRLNIFTTTFTNELEDGTEVLDPQRTYSSLVTLKPTYTFKWKGFEPYIALGFGPHFLVNRTIFDESGEIQSQTNQTVSFIPEVGLGIADFSISLKTVIGGRINGFDEMDANGNRVVLAENRLVFFYITGSYRFKISKN
jgi:hypothetical protein